MWWTWARPQLSVDIQPDSPDLDLTAVSCGCTSAPFLLTGHSSCSNIMRFIMCPAGCSIKSSNCLPLTSALAVDHFQSAEALTWRSSSTCVVIHHPERLQIHPGGDVYSTEPLSSRAGVLFMSLSSPCSWKDDQKRTPCGRSGFVLPTAGWEFIYKGRLEFFTDVNSLESTNCDNSRLLRLQSWMLKGLIC